MAQEYRCYKYYQKAYQGFHYSVLGQQELTYIHDKTLEMLRIIIPILEEYKIRYFLCDSTLRGAAVLGKMLPWDDDIDLCVWEEDYGRMISVLREALPDWMALQCAETEAKYYHGWAKVRDKKSHVYPDEPLYVYNGVFIDLYVLSSVPKSQVEHVIAEEHLDYLNRRYAVGGISREEYDKRIKENNLLERIKYSEQDSECNKAPSGDVMIVWSRNKTLMKPEWCFPQKRISFEGMKLYSFNCAEKYLSEKYGAAFRELPPDELRFITYDRVEYVYGNIL